MRNLFLSIFMFLCLPFGFSQTNSGLPVLDKRDLPEANFGTSRIFTGGSLFGYIDGGAELYLEYGFISASVTEVELAGRNYKIEIFRMNGPEEAFGIFSVSRFKCVSMPDLSEFTCQTKYQLQLCKGPYYISVINKGGTSADSLNSIEICRIIAGKVQNEGSDFLSAFPEMSTEAVRKNGFLAKGRIGLVNGDPDLEDFFKDISVFTALVSDAGDKKCISVRFDNSEQYMKFLDLHKWTVSEIQKKDTSLPGVSGIRLTGENHLFITLEQ